MDINRDLNNNRNNQMYYNQMIKSRKRRGKSKSFASKKIDVKDIVLAPEGYEGIFLFIYCLIVPYLAGAVFLFFFVAGADYSNFMLLNMSSIFIVWAIGYEVVATIALLIIFIMFLFYDDES